MILLMLLITYFSLIVTIGYSINIQCTDFVLLDTAYLGTGDIFTTISADVIRCRDPNNEKRFIAPKKINWKLTQDVDANNVTVGVSNEYLIEPFLDIEGYLYFRWSVEAVNTDALNSISEGGIEVITPIGQFSIVNIGFVSGSYDITVLSPIRVNIFGSDVFVQITSKTSKVTVIASGDSDTIIIDAPTVNVQLSGNDIDLQIKSSDNTTNVSIVGSDNRILIDGPVTITDTGVNNLVIINNYDLGCDAVTTSDTVSSQCKENTNDIIQINKNINCLSDPGQDEFGCNGVTTSSGTTTTANTIKVITNNNNTALNIATMMTMVILLLSSLCT